MRIILVHGMGRTPLSMAWLGLRLRFMGHRVSFFSYSTAREGFHACVARLKTYIADHGDKEYIAVGHSLGTVLLRAALSEFSHQPHTAFLIAPPTEACAMARFFSGWKLYQWATGEMGQLLADEKFMRELPAPPNKTLIFAGDGGPKHRCLPYGARANDGVLAVEETQLRGCPIRVVSAIHTFIMNHPVVIRAISSACSEAT
jgi:pimeloyl-ACP methyl ester carboxylesterase